MDTKNLFEIEAMFILLIAIPLLFILKNYLYKRQGFEVKKSEEIIFLLICFFALIIPAGLFDSRFLFFCSIPFLIWFLIPVIKWEISLWKKPKITELSLCENCYCMTKTINNKCGKCNGIKKNDTG